MVTLVACIISMVGYKIFGAGMTLHSQMNEQGTSACVDGVIACCQIVPRRNIDRRVNRETTSRLSVVKLMNFIRGNSLGIYATRYTEKARGINFFVRKESPRKTIPYRKKGRRARSRLDLSNISPVKEQRRRGRVGGRGRGGRVSLFECRVCESKRESIGNDWKRLNKAQVKTVIRKVDGP